MAAVGLAVASFLFSQRVEAKVIKLAKEDRSKTIEVTVGDILEITLPENASTGYVWKPGKMDTSIVKFRKKDTRPPKPGLMGGGTKVTMLFDVIGAGKTEFRLIARKHPKNSGESGQTYRLTIIAK